LVEVGPDRPERQVVHLEVIVDPPAGNQAPAARSVQPARELSWHRDGWLRIAERGLGDWASSLRTAFLMLIGLAGIIVLIGLTFDFEGAALGTLLAVIVYLVAVGRSSR
jgi:hypothetical protein